MLETEEQNIEEPPAKKKKIYLVNNKPCSSTWFYKVRKRQREEITNNKDLQHKERAEAEFERLNILAEEQKELEQKQESVNDWLQNSLSLLQHSRDSYNMSDGSLSPAQVSGPDTELIVTPPIVMPELDQSLPQEEFISNDVKPSFEEQQCDSGATRDENKKTKKRKDRKLTELLPIFVQGNVRQNTQKKLLKYMKSLTPDMVKLLPADGRSLQPPQIEHIERPLDPGHFCYFGIAKILDTPGVELFDKSLNTVHLTVFTDETPLYKCADEGNLWPILGSCQQYPVFLIAMYKGRTKPTCSNLFIRELVFEIKQLCTKGLIVDGDTYQFQLHRMVMDAPAMSYILGVTGHVGYNCCKRCNVIGSLTFIGLNKKGGRVERVRFLDLDAFPRMHEDFVSFLKTHSDPHVALSSLSAPSVEQNSSQVLEESVSTEKSSKKKSGKKKRGDSASAKDRKNTYHQHPTILATIPYFDVVCDIVLDYMHLICLGIVKALLLRWVRKGSPFKMMDTKIAVLNNRLTNARKYTPAEFQRKPQTVDNISDWKATQYRVFLLYIGVVVLHGILDKAYLTHFHLLAAAIRSMCRRLHMTGVERQRIITSVASTCRHLTKEFVRSGVKLYSEKFAVYNTHSLIHIPDDYERFGPLDESSAFKYESFLGRLKRMVTAQFEPMVQIINKYSSLLFTEQFGQCGNRDVNITEEYFETPELRRPVDYDMDSEVAVSEDDSDDNVHYQCYEEMRFKNFVLRSDTLGDRHCLIGTHTYMRIHKILKNRDSGEISLVGHVFQDVKPLFSTIQIPSTDFGINLCLKLSDTLTTVTLDKLNEKCFALPLHPEESQSDAHDNDEWVFVRYLH